IGSVWDLRRRICINRPRSVLAFLSRRAVPRGFIRRGGSPDLSASASRELPKGDGLTMSPATQARMPKITPGKLVSVRFVAAPTGADKTNRQQLPRYFLQQSITVHRAHEPAPSLLAGGTVTRNRHQLPGAGRRLRGSEPLLLVRAAPAQPRGVMR